MINWQLQQFQQTDTALGALMGLVGVAFLYTGWRRQHRDYPMLIASWSLLLLSGWYWQQGTGFDTGIALCLIFISLVALITLLLNAHWPAITTLASSSPKTTQAVTAQPHRKKFIRRYLFNILIATLIAGPLSLATAFFIALGIFTILPGSEATRLIGSAMLVPILWAALMVCACAPRKQLHAVVINSLLGGVSFLGFIALN